MKNNAKVRISFRAATVKERVVIPKWHRIKQWMSYSLAYARGSVWVDQQYGASFS